MTAMPSIRLDALTEDDRDSLFHWINDPDLVRHNAPFRPVSQDSHAKWFREIGLDRRNVFFAIRCDGRLIGTVQLRHIHPIHRNAELVIRIGDRQSQGKGIGTVALTLTLDFAWRDLNLHRVYLNVLSSNERALRAYRRVGFQEEGRLRQAAFIDGKWHDLLVMGVLREW